MLALIIVLLLTMLRLRGPESRDGIRYPEPDGLDPGASGASGRKLKPCPLCGHLLEKGQTVRSKVIEIASSGRHGANKLGVKESMAHVFGCPWCWPARREQARTCPACKAQLGQEDFVVARYFEKAEGRNHLHVLGCTRCRKI